MFVEHIQVEARYLYAQINSFPDSSAPTIVSRIKPNANDKILPRKHT